VILALVLGCSAAASQPQAKTQTQTARGVLLEVVSPGIQQVDRFTLRTDDGQILSFVAASDFNAGATPQGGGLHAMTPGHMRQHMALADPVVVTYRQDNGVLIALSATDANQ
jgi:hypothetical protein